MTLSLRWGPFEAELRSIPRNSGFGQYLPWNTRTHGYDTSEFDPRLCEGQLSLEELRLIIEQLQTSPYYRIDRVPIPCWLIPPIVVFLIVTISLLNRDRPFSLVRRLIIMLCLALMLILPVLLMWAAKRVSARRDRERVGRLKTALKRLQAAHLANRGVDLRISSLGSYLVIDTSRGLLGALNQSHNLPAAIIAPSDLNLLQKPEDQMELISNSEGRLDQLPPL